MTSPKHMTARHLLPALALVLGQGGAAPAWAQSQCFIPVQFCDGCTFSSSMSVSSGERCTVSHDYKGGLVSLRVTRKPQNGIAATSVNAYAYVPKPGFSGQDAFSIEIKYRTGAGIIETTNVNYAVTVR